MKLIIHIGLNKAGSTSLQNELWENREILCKEFNVFYKTYSEEFNNHYDFYSLLESGNAKASQEYLENYISEARNASAKAAIISSEDLFSLSSNIGNFSNLLSLLDSLDSVDSEFLLVTRSYENWAKSYIMQLLRNGALSNSSWVELVGLGGYLASGIRSWRNTKFPIQLVDLESRNQPGGFVNNMMKRLGYDTKFNNRHDNRTGKERFLTSEVLIGFVIGLKSRINDVHPNANEMDFFRNELESVINELAHESGVSYILNYFERYLKEYINVFVDRTISCLSEEDSALLRSCQILK